MRKVTMETAQKTTEEKTVYVATKGKYSSYHIWAVFEDKGLADEFVQLYSRDSWDGKVTIEEWTLDQVVPKVYNFQVIMDIETGNVLEEEILHEPTLDPFDGLGFGIACLWSSGKLRAIGADREEALKNAADFRREHLAR